MKRVFDLVVSAAALLVLSPMLLAVAIAIWLQDFQSPFYVAPRVARGGRTFKMFKYRSMTVGADRSGVDSTGANDTRITPIGRILRRYKLDELMQLWNVFLGDMSLVGPRPQVQREVDIYTDIERMLLNARPGITDLSSIVFSDESEILKDAVDPDLAYNQLIRPWKSRLGLLYVKHSSLKLDCELILTTALSIVSRQSALVRVQKILKRLDADVVTRSVALRTSELTPYPPPGALSIVLSREALSSAS